MRLGDDGSQHGAHTSVDVIYVGVELDGHHVLARTGGVGNEECRVEGLVQVEVGCHAGKKPHAICSGNVFRELGCRAIKQAGEVAGVGLVVAFDAHLSQTLRMTHHLVNGAEAQTCHVLAQVLRHEGHEVDHVFGPPCEAAAQALVLRANAYRAGVLVTVTLHETAQGDERHGGEAELLCAKQCGDSHVAPVHELSIGFEHHARAEAVHE